MEIFRRDTWYYAKVNTKRIFIKKNHRMVACADVFNKRTRREGCRAKKRLSYEYYFPTLHVYLKKYASIRALNI